MTEHCKLPDCSVCELERIGCGCDGADDDGCWICTPDRHQRPPCKGAEAPETCCACDTIPGKVVEHHEGHCGHNCTSCDLQHGTPKTEGETYEDRVKNWKGVCAHCGKPTSFACNYCDWDCQVAAWRATGAKEHLPNGLPIKCLPGEGLMLECEHGDHPTYIFPVTAQYIGTPPKGHEDEYGDETHALIYTDGWVALTIHECTFYLWHLASYGKLLYGPRGGETNYRLSDESIEKILAHCVCKEG